jgi:hypothetical protein
LKTASSEELFISNPPRRILSEELFIIPDLGDGFLQCSNNDSWLAPVAARPGCTTACFQKAEGARSQHLSTGVRIHGALAASLGRPREYGLAGGTEAPAVLGEASNNALLVGDELVAKPEHVIGAGLLLGLSATIGLLRAGGGLRRKEQPCRGEAQQ